MRPAVVCLTASLLLLSVAPLSAAESPAEQISGFRLKHGEVRVIRDATLDRIALEQARAMAAKDSSATTPSDRSIGASLRPARGAPPRILPTGTTVFEKTLGQWIEFKGASQEPVVAQSVPRWRGECQGCKRQAHLLGDGHCRRLRAEGRQERHAASGCCQG